MENGLCLVCSQEPVSTLDFKAFIENCRLGYILDEYVSLESAWSVLQGIVYYRTYRGMSTDMASIDKPPALCVFCLTKLVNLVKAVYDLTSVLEKKVKLPPINPSPGKLPPPAETPPPSRRAAQLSSPDSSTPYSTPYSSSSKCSAPSPKRPANDKKISGDANERKVKDEVSTSFENKVGQGRSASKVSCSNNQKCKDQEQDGSEDSKKKTIEKRVTRTPVLQEAWVTRKISKNSCDEIKEIKSDPSNAQQSDRAAGRSSHTGAASGSCHAGAAGRSCHAGAAAGSCHAGAAGRSCHAVAAAGRCDAQQPSQQSGRPRRTRGRSLIERNPDFVNFTKTGGISGGKSVDTSGYPKVKPDDASAGYLEGKLDDTSGYPPSPSLTPSPDLMEQDSGVAMMVSQEDKVPEIETNRVIGADNLTSKNAQNTNSVNPSMKSKGKAASIVEVKKRRHSVPTKVAVQPEDRPIVQPGKRSRAPSLKKIEAMKSASLVTGLVTSESSSDSETTPQPTKGRGKGWQEKLTGKRSADSLDQVPSKRTKGRRSFPDIVPDPGCSMENIEKLPPKRNRVPSARMLESLGGSSSSSGWWNRLSGLDSSPAESVTTEKTKVSHQYSASPSALDPKLTAPGGPSTTDGNKKLLSTPIASVVPVPVQMSENDSPPQLTIRVPPPKSFSSSKVTAEDKEEIDLGGCSSEDWRSDQFRSTQLLALDTALKEAKWSIKSGKFMEKEVFDNARNQHEYLAGISNLVAHFGTPSSASTSGIVGSPTRAPSAPRASPALRAPSAPRDSPTRAPSAPRAFPALRASSAPRAPPEASPAVGGSVSQKKKDEDVSDRPVIVAKKTRSTSRKSENHRGRAEGSTDNKTSTETDVDAAKPMKEDGNGSGTHKLDQDNLNDGHGQPKSEGTDARQDKRSSRRSNLAKTQGSGVKSEDNSTSTTKEQQPKTIKVPKKVMMTHDNYLCKGSGQDTSRKSDKIISIVGKGRINCPVCGILQARSEFLHHIKSSHQGGKCSKCTKILCTKDEMITHKTEECSKVENKPVIGKSKPVPKVTKPVFDEKTAAKTGIQRLESKSSPGRVKPKFIVKKSVSGKKGKRYLDPDQYVQQSSPSQVPENNADESQSSGTKSTKKDEGKESVPDKNINTSGISERLKDEVVESSSESDSAMSPKVPVTRPHRKIRSMEERNPDFVLQMSRRSTKVSKSKESKTKIEQTNGLRNVSRKIEQKNDAPINETVDSGGKSVNDVGKLMRKEFQENDKEVQEIQVIENETTKNNKEAMEIQLIENKIQNKDKEDEEIQVIDTEEAERKEEGEEEDTRKKDEGNEKKMEEENDVKEVEEKDDEKKAEAESNVANKWFNINQD